MIFNVEYSDNYYKSFNKLNQVVINNMKQFKNYNYCLLLC